MIIIYKNGDSCLTLIVEKSQMQTPEGIIPLRYATISDGRGYHCCAGNCGLCCVIERGQGKGSEGYLSGASKCSELDHYTKLCKSYEQRPVLCRMFPFLSSADLNELVISPSLACPYVGCEEPFFDLEDFEKMLRENDMVLNIWDRFLKATLMYKKSQQVLLSPIKATVFIKKVMIYPPQLDRIREIIKHNFNELAGNPNFLRSTVESINYQIFQECRYEPESYGEKFVEEIRKLPFPTLERVVELFFQKQEGITCSYITPATSSADPSVMQYYKKGKSLFFRDAFSGKKWELNKKSYLKPLELERAAGDLIGDYLDLLVERNYLIQSRVYPAANMLQGYKSFIVSLAQITVAAVSTVVRRHQAGTVSRDVMREALAMADARACFTIYW